MTDSGRMGDVAARVGPTKKVDLFEPPVKVCIR